VGTLAVGEKATITINTNISPDAPVATNIVNMATAASFEMDSNSSDNSASWTSHLFIDYPGYSLTNPTVTEGDAGTVPAVFTVTLNQTACVPLKFTYQTGTVANPALAATSGVDFMSASGGFSIPAGSTKYDVPVTVVSDKLVEIDELFELTVAADFPGPVLSSTATATIVNDDVPPSVQLSGSTSVNEGTSALYSFTVTSTGPFSINVASCGIGSIVGTVNTTQNANGGGTGSFTCTLANGPANTQVKVQVSGNGALSNVSAIDVAVSNLAPVVVLTGPQSVDSGAIETYQFSVTDAGSDAFSPTPLYPTCGAKGSVVDGSAGR